MWTTSGLGIGGYIPQFPCLKYLEVRQSRGHSHEDNMTVYGHQNINIQSSSKSLEGHLISGPCYNLCANQDQSIQELSSSFLQQAPYNALKKLRLEPEHVSTNTLKYIMNRFPKLEELSLCVDGK